MFDKPNTPGIRTGCSLNNGGCSHLCFAKPDMSRVCGCSSHFVLNEDGVTCIGGFRNYLVLNHELFQTFLSKRFLDINFRHVNRFYSRETNHPTQPSTSSSTNKRANKQTRTQLHIKLYYSSLLRARSQTADCTWTGIVARGVRPNKRDKCLVSDCSAYREYHWNCCFRLSHS